MASREDKATIFDSKSIRLDVLKILATDKLIASAIPADGDVHLVTAGVISYFADLIATPSSEKVFLAEIQLAEEIAAWTLTPAQYYTYQVSFLNETITLTDSSTEIIRKAVIDLQLDAISLTAETSIATVEATAGTYWHDTTNALLYIHPTDNGSPTHHTTMALFWLYLATKGIILAGRYYEPYIAEGGIPGISQSLQESFWGISQISIGSVILLNGRGFFDQIANKFYWTNKKIRILLGGESLPYPEYNIVFTGQIIKKIFTKEDLTLDIRSKTFDLLRQIPINHFWKSNLPNLDPAAEGKTIPYAWGNFDSEQAPIVTCIDSTYSNGGIPGYKFQICDPAIHAIKAIAMVYVDYKDGTGWHEKGHYDEDLTNATFALSLASIPDFVLGTTVVKVAFQGYHYGGNPIEGAPEIVEDILLSVCGYDGDDLNWSSFSKSKTDSVCSLNVFLDEEISALSVIEKICQSDFAFFDENGEGELRYRTMTAISTGTVDILTSEDILDSSIPAITESPEQIYYKVRIGYSYSMTNNEFLYREKEYAAAKYRYGKNDLLALDTYLRTAIDAHSLAGKLLWLLRNISPTLDISLKISQITKLIGDRVKITLNRAPYSTAGGYNERVFEVIGMQLSCFPVIQILTLRDLVGFGESVGTWMEDTAPNWITATAAERLVSGFWTDADGYADPPNAISLNKSLWW